MEQIRVLVLISNMDTAGAQTLAMNYLRHVDRRHIRFDFLVNHAGMDDYEEEIRALGGEVYRMCPIKLHTINRYKREFRQFLQNHKDYQVIHSYLEERSLYALRIAKEMGVPVRICQANSYPNHFQFTLPILYFLKLKQRKYFTHCMATSREASDWLFGVKRRRGVIFIKKAIDVNRFKKDLIGRDNAKKMLELQSNFVVGHIGRFDRKKTYEKLLAVFAEIKRRNSKAVLLLIGGGKNEREVRCREKIQERARELRLEESVRFLGVRNDVDRLMQAMDVLVIPTTNYNCSLTLIEAQSMGLACVVSDNISWKYNLTGNVEFLPLEMKHSVWADKILKKVTEPMVDRTYLVTDRGYDIREAAKVLQDFYIREVEFALRRQALGEKNEGI